MGMLIFFPDIAGTSVPLNSCTAPWVKCKGSRRTSSHLSCYTDRNAPTLGGEPEKRLS